MKEIKIVVNDDACGERGLWFIVAQLMVVYWDYDDGDDKFGHV